MRKRATRFLSLALTGALCFSLAACGGNGGDAPAPDAGTQPTQAEPAAQTQEPAKKLNINVIVNTTASEYWNYVSAGAKAYGDEHENVTVNVVGPAAETAFDEQMNMIETALSSGQYDGMVLSPLAPDMALTKITGAEIPIVAVNTNIEAPEIRTFVGTGNEAAAAEGGKSAVAAAKAAGWETINAIAIAGTQGEPTGQQRVDGFQRGITEAGGTFLENEIQYADWVADKAVASMEAIMQTHPEGVAIIVTANDDMAIAAARTAQGNPAYEKTVFCGFDGIQSACKAILEGLETMSVAQDAYGMGYKAVDACVRAIGGEELPEFIDTGCEIVDSSNAQARLDTLLGYTS